MNKESFERSADLSISNNLLSLLEAQREYGGVYMAILPSIDDGIYALEIEVNEGTIALTWHTGTKVLKEARAEADYFESVLKRHGVHVYKLRSDWDKALGF